MNIRLRDSFIRVRLSPEDVDALLATGRVERETWVPGAPRPLRYALAAAPQAAGSGAELGPLALTITLSSADLSSIADPSRDGVTIRREWSDPQGCTRRALIVVERDRMGERPSPEESWLTDRSPSDDHTQEAS